MLLSENHRYTDPCEWIHGALIFTSRSYITIQSFCFLFKSSLKLFAYSALIEFIRIFYDFTKFHQYRPRFSFSKSIFSDFYLSSRFQLLLFLIFFVLVFRFLFLRFKFFHQASKFLNTV